MKVVVLYHPNTEQAGLVQDFARDYQRFKNKKLELISLETLQGSNLARLYDVTQYPAFLALDSSGSLQRMWQGTPIPLLNELDYYTYDLQHADYAGGLAHQLRLVPSPTP
ncbi:hypothetical protein BVY00_01005 [bacterium G20]|nr:hypothetical protein BVY00_01005 [bacterium G20]